MGIGTSSPEFLVTATAANLPYIGSVTANVKTVLASDETNGRAYIGTRTNHPVSLMVDGDERMRIDAAGRVGIGTISPSNKLHVNGGYSGAVNLETVYSYGQNNYAIKINGNPSTSGGYLGQYADVGGLEVGHGASFHGGGSTHKTDAYSTSAAFSRYHSGVISFFTNASLTAGATYSPTERMRIDSDGVTTFKYNTKVYTAGYPETRLGITDSNYFNFTFDNPNDSLAIGKNGSTKMSLTAAGNLLVGTTDPIVYNEGSTGNSGVVISSDNYYSAARKNGPTLFLNRQSSDGAIAQFYKDGTTVGSINTLSGNLSIGSGNAGLRFNPPFGELLPHNISTNTGTDATVILGSGGVRFKDLYLSGGVYLGGTGAANKLDDYETGSWTPSFSGSTGNPTVSYNTQTATYTKVGALVIVTAFIVTNSSSGGSGHLTVTGLPFTVASGQDYGAVVAFNFNWVSGENPHYAMGQSGTNHILLYKDATTNSNSEPNDILASGNTYLRLTMSYLTA